MTESRIAIFPGSFDPFTMGHLDTVQRASLIFDSVVIAVMTNTSKAPTFEANERVQLATSAVKDLSNVSVLASSACLTVDVAKRLGASFILRGIRNVKDFEYERDIAAMNLTQTNQIETIFLVASPQFSFLSSSMIKEIARFGGDIAHLVPPDVAKALKRKYNRE